jgi:hypothetical protein
MRQALNSMESNGTINVALLKSDGAKRTRGFPEGVIVNFP